MVGILTFHDTNNFGSLLQTYGLYKKIVDLGYECEVIDYKCDNLIRREIPKSFTFMQSPKKLVLDIYLGSAKRKKYQCLSRFAREKMIISPPCNKSNIFRIAERYDKIIVGSDIVWGCDITGCDLNYFLNFCREKNKKYAFSSSIGNEWDIETQAVVKPLLQDFNYIAVREEESADWIKNLTGVRPDVVSDPTMLLTAKDWLNQVPIGNDIFHKERYVLVYFENSNGDCIRAAQRIAAEKRISVKFINYGIPKHGIDNITPYSLNDFLSLIYNASHVVTASYHGLLFSLYFNKEFTFFNRAHKSRMNTLSTKLGIANRNGCNGDVLHLPPINYDTLNSTMELYRNYSVEKLKKILEM